MDFNEIRRDISQIVLVIASLVVPALIATPYLQSISGADFKPAFNLAVTIPLSIVFFGVTYKIYEWYKELGKRFLLFFSLLSLWLFWGIGIAFAKNVWMNQQTFIIKEPFLISNGIIYLVNIMFILLIADMGHWVLTERSYLRMVPVKVKDFFRAA